MPIDDPDLLNRRKMSGEDGTWPWYTNFVGQMMQHNYWQYDVIGRLLGENPQVRGILEIGTGNGALTVLLGCWGRRLGIPVATYDIDMGRSAPVRPVLSALGVSIHEEDCFSEESRKRIAGFLSDHAPVYLLCDGGDKPREMRTFGPLLSPGSLLSGHDWGLEITEKDITPLLETHGFSRWNPGAWMEKNVQFMTLKKDA